MLTDTLDIELSAKTRSLLDAQYTVVLVILLLCAAVGAGLVFTTYVNPDTQTEQQTISSFTVSSEYSHSAAVTESNPIFPVGTELDDRNSYFTEVSPQLTVQIESAYSGDEPSDVTLEQESTLVTEHSDGTNVFWDRTETLGQSGPTEVSADETVSSAFIIDTAVVADEIEAVEDALGASPGDTDVVVRTDIDVSAVIDGETVTESITIELDIDLGGGTYTVSNPGTQTTTVEQTEFVTATQQAGWLRLIGGPLLLIGGLIGSVLLRSERRRGTFGVTDHERQYLDYRNDRDEFDDWITRMTLPSDVIDRPTGNAESLADLVDFAIDNNTSVVQPPGEDTFYVVADGSLYRYRPPSRPESIEY